jgi:ficolin
MICQTDRTGHLSDRQEKGEEITFFYCSKFLIAGDSLTDASRSWRYHNNQRFTTKDSDNDQRFGSNCADDWSGGWWFNACVGANLNGNYTTDAGTENLKRVNWFYWHRDWRSFRSTQMMIKPRG